MQSVASLYHPISVSQRHETIYASFVSILRQFFPFFHNLAILLFSEIVIFMNRSNLVRSYWARHFTITARLTTWVVRRNWYLLNSMLGLQITLQQNSIPPWTVRGEEKYFFSHVHYASKTSISCGVLNISRITWLDTIKRFL